MESPSLENTRQYDHSWEAQGDHWGAGEGRQTLSPLSYHSDPSANISEGKVAALEKALKRSRKKKQLKTSASSTDARREPHSSRIPSPRTEPAVSGASGCPARLQGMASELPGLTQQALPAAGGGCGAPHS